MGERLQEISFPEPEAYFGATYSSADGRDNGIIRRAGVPQSLHGTTAGNLVNGNNSSDDPDNMWIVKRANAVREGFIVLRFTFAHETALKGLRVWNLNSGGTEGALGGIKHASIYLDGQLRMKSIVARKAPGVACNYDFAQFLPVVGEPSAATAVPRSSRGEAVWKSNQSQQPTSTLDFGDLNLKQAAEMQQSPLIARLNVHGNGDRLSPLVSPDSMMDDDSFIKEDQGEAECSFDDDIDGKELQQSMGTLYSSDALDRSIAGGG